MALYLTIFHMTYITDIYIYIDVTQCYFWSWGDGCCFCNPCAISEDRFVTSWRVLALQWSASTALKAASLMCGWDVIFDGGVWMVGEDQRKIRWARTCIRFAWRLRKRPVAIVSPRLRREKTSKKSLNWKYLRSRLFPSGPVQQLGE